MIMMAWDGHGAVRAWGLAGARAAVIAVIKVCRSGINYFGWLAPRQFFGTFPSPTVWKLD